MKKSLVILITVLFTVAGYAETPSSIVGTYASLGMFENRVIMLMPDGTYHAGWSDDTGGDGSASGSWELIGDEVRLTPNKEEGRQMRGKPLRVLLLREWKGTPALLRKEDGKHADGYGSYLILMDKKHKPTVATPAPATPAAPAG